MVISVFDDFQMQSQECIDFKFRDNLKSSVNAEDLGDLILQRKGCGAFFIELVFDNSLLTLRAEVIQ